MLGVCFLLTLEHFRIHPIRTMPLRCSPRYLCKRSFSRSLPPATFWVLRGEQALKARLEKRSNGIPVLLTCPAAVAAFRTFWVGRIALIHPPWFAGDEQELGVAYFRKQGIDVVYAKQMRLRGLSIAKPTDPLRKFTELYPAELYAFARAEVPPTAEAVFFGGNGFRAIGMIAALEEELGRPVLTGNQVAFWYALRQADVRKPVNGYGRVFRTLNSEGGRSQG